MTLLHRYRASLLPRKVLRVSSSRGLLLLEALGIDRAVFSALAARGWSLLAGPITLVIIARALTPQQQGFYYTFASVMALQIFLDMGLSYVLVQFVSHEFAKVRWTADGGIEGDSFATARLLEILRTSTKWYMVASALLVLLFVPLGFIFFGSQGQDGVSFAWRLPWTLYVVTSALNLSLVPLYSIVEGGGLVAEINQFRFVQTVLANLVIWGALLAGAGLFVPSIMGFASVVSALVWAGATKRQLLRLIFKTPRSVDPKGTVPSFDWWRELWPMQWRIAISWISGYFIFQLYTPVLFRYQGAVIAGKMGMTLTLTNALTQIAMAWVTVRAPKFGMLVAGSKWRELDALFARVFRQSVLVVLLGAVALVGVVWFVQQYTASGQRILPAAEVAFMAGSVVLNHVIGAIAVYLRAHKRDPFVWLSLIGAVLMGISTWLLGQYLSSVGVVIGTFAINLCYGVPTAVWLWYKLRREWHGEPVST